MKLRPMHRHAFMPSSRGTRTAVHLLALVAYGVILTSAAALSRYQPSTTATATTKSASLSTRSRVLHIPRGGANHNAVHGSRRHKHNNPATRAAGGGAGGSEAPAAAAAPASAIPDAVQVSGADLASSGASQLDGIYLREWDVNGAPHFKKRSNRGSRAAPVHLFFTGNEWMLHLDVDANLDINHCLAYSEVPELNPLKTTRKWAVRLGQAWVRRPHMRLSEKTLDAETKRSAWGSQAAPGSTGPHLYDDAGGGRHTMHHLSSDASSTASATTTSSADAEAMTDSALSRRLLPLYLVFVLDAVGLGVALPVLPFYVMGLKATALQLAIVVSTNYIAQTFGCVITGNLSDIVGRKPVVIGCLMGTVISHITVARSTTLAGVAWGRMIGGVTGGLTPIAQAAVADVVPVQSLPKFLGRIQACVGLGFVLGPMTMTILHRLLNVSTADTFYAAALFPLVGLLYAMFRMKETKVGETGMSQLWQKRRGSATSEASTSSPPQSQMPSSGSTGERAEADGSAFERRDKAGQDEAMSSHRRRRRHKHRTGHSDSVEGREGAQQHQQRSHAGDAMRHPAQEDNMLYGMDGDFADAATPGMGDAMASTTVTAGEAGSRSGSGVRLDVAGENARDVLDSDASRGAGEVIPRAVLLLVGNGFLLMYAFSIETIYAMFLKDNFGYGESVLSMVFALNGVAVGALQLLGMRHLVRLLGKHMMLVVGNMFLAAGMVGVALSREPAVHFALFTIHIMGYSLADTALVALISRYASPATQGRSLGLNQAAQSLARVVSPVVAGVLYEWSKRRHNLPLGSLPYLVGSVFPLVGVAVPFMLYLRSIEEKKRRGVYARGGGAEPQSSAASREDNTEQTSFATHDPHEKFL